MDNAFRLNPPAMVVDGLLLLLGLSKLEIKMKRKLLQKSLIGITSAAVIGAMSSGAMAAEEVTDWRVG
jgi:hypothetical protein